MKLALLTASLLSLSVAAQAQMVFDGADITVDAVFPLTGGFTDSTKIGVTGRAAISFGSIGIQADIGYDTATGSVLPPSFYTWDAGLHTYYKISETVKVGAFYTSENLELLGQYSTFGVEAMLGFGKLDVELSIAGSEDIGADLVIVTADGYYQINDTLEVSAGVSSYINEFGHISIASIGADYTLANLPVSLGAAYTHGFSSNGNGSGDSISVNVFYSFGGTGGQRLFQNRNMDYLNLLYSFGVNP